MTRSLKLLGIALLSAGLLQLAHSDAKAAPVSTAAIAAVRGADAQPDALVFTGGRGGRRGGFQRRERDRDQQDFSEPREERQHHGKRRRHKTAKKKPLHKPNTQQVKKATGSPAIEQATLPPKKSDTLQSGTASEQNSGTGGPPLSTTLGQGTSTQPGGVVAQDPNIQVHNPATLAGGSNRTAGPGPLGNTPIGHPVLNTPGDDTGHHTPNNPHHGQGHHPTPDDHQGPGHHQNGDSPTGGRPGGHRPGTQVVCLGGRFRGGDCGCGGAVRRQLRQAVFICGGGVGRDIPGFAATPIGVAAAPPSNGTSNQPPAPAAPGQRAAIVAPSLPPFAPDQVLVTVASDAPESLDQLVAQSFGLDVLGRWPLALIGSRLVLYRIPDGRAVQTVVAALQGDARISAPQPNYYYGLQAEPSEAAVADPALDLQYALAKLEVRAANRIATGRGVRVAVIDSQIDRSHPDLDGAIAEGFDAAERAEREPDAHGTAIAGIIGGRGLVSGVAPDATLLAVNAFGPTGAHIPAATTATLLRGLDWALKHGARIVNLSVAGPFDPLMQRGTEVAVSDGAIIVAAAGNKGEGAPPAYPAAYPNVIAVTAVDIGDRLYESANRGSYVELAAPGVDVLTSALEHAHLLQTGTSFAAAHISGMIALMLEREPYQSLDDVREALSRTAKDLGAPGRDELFGAGEPNALALLGALDQRDTPAAPERRQTLSERASEN